MDVFALTLRLKEEGAASVRAATLRLGDAAKRSSGDLKQMDNATKALSSSMRSLALGWPTSACVRPNSLPMTLVYKSRSRPSCTTVRDR